MLFTPSLSSHAERLLGRAFEMELRPQTGDEIIAELIGHYVHPWAMAMIQAMPKPEKLEKILVTLVRPRDLGISECLTIPDFVDELDELKLRRCPAAAGPILERWASRPNADLNFQNVRVAMEPVIAAGGYQDTPGIFHRWNGGLFGDAGGNSVEFSSESCWLVRLE